MTKKNIIKDLQTRLRSKNGSNLKGGYLINDVRELRRGLNVPRRQQRRNVTLPPLSHTPSTTNPNPNTPIILPAISLTPWVADEDCRGQVDPITEESIEEGHGFKLMENDRETCYDVVTLAKIMRLNEPLTPYTRVPFSETDRKRIIDYMTRNPIGGKKKKTYKKQKINNTKKSKKIIKKRKTRRIK